ncbi:tetratricopeptide repeat protein [Acinetobacter sp.]|jgi:tetratricopeptide (TPR) repeat protein|uniref:tetratricopeptide repeat protein n=1 Tax=Acinetobacter sp. TaxID=472 RepID=UPI0028388060|nr:tetratricopeptide repeat protein [Acinetobacter sp.]MDR0234710.1 tetratricopeptide repeat protein [Acinetobacter sp.]
MELKKQFTMIASLSYFAVSLAFAQNIVVEGTRDTSQSESNNVQNLEKNMLDEKLADDALEKANQYLIAGLPQQGIVTLHTTIQYFEKYQNSCQYALYAASGTAETLLYLTLDIGKQKNIRVFSGAWADLYFQTAYAYIEMSDWSNAQSALQKALLLSPFNSGYLKELGFIQQAQKQWQASLESFKAAEEYVYLIEPEQKRLAIQQGIRRSLGVSLIELNQLDEAVQYLNKVLEVDPSDSKARNELKYIEELKKKGDIAKQPIGRV